MDRGLSGGGSGCACPRKGAGWTSAQLHVLPISPAHTRLIDIGLHWITSINNGKL